MGVQWKGGPMFLINILNFIYRVLQLTKNSPRTHFYLVFPNFPDALLMIKFYDWENKFREVKILHRMTQQIINETNSK